MLPRSSIFASFTILIWLIFTPSAWQGYLKRIDPALSPDFVLTDLRHHHWQQPELQRLLFLGHGLWSLWVTTIVVLGEWRFGSSPYNMLLAGCYALSFSIVGGLLGSLTVSVAFGIIVGVFGSISLSFFVGDAGTIIFAMAENIAIVVMLSVSDLPTFSQQNNLSPALLTVLFGIFIAGFAGNIMYHTTTTPIHRQSFHRQIGSIVIGVVVSSFAVFSIVALISYLVRGAATLMQNGDLFNLVFDSLIGGLFGLFLTFIWGWNTSRWGKSLLAGLTVSLGFILLTFLKNNTTFPSQPLLMGLHGGVENALLYTILFTFPYFLARKIANSWAGIIAGVFASGAAYTVFSLVTQAHALSFIIPLILTVLVLGLIASWWQPLLLYPFFAAWNVVLHRADERGKFQPSLLRWHSAFWDEKQYLPLFGLEDYLIMVAERDPAEAQRALEHLSNTPQSWAAQAAQIELDARRLQNCSNVEAISNTHRHLAAGELNGPASALLRSFSRVSRDVEAALAQESSYNQRLALVAVEERLDGLLRELTRSSEPYALRFRPIAAEWRQTLSRHTQALSKAVENRQEINNPYVIGIPLTEHQEIFVGRSDVSERIERLLLDQRCPPLLLYGQRRTGKTSLLNNLGRLLPWRIIPLFVDMQGPTSLAKNYEGFLYNVGRAMQTSAKRHREVTIPPLKRENLQLDPFTSFDEWLDEIEHTLDAEQTILLTLDEFSALEHIFAKRLLDEESVLGMFRHLIQHRSRFKILLSGSHTIDEFERWASYLINVQTVHLNYLQLDEAIQLVEQPVKEFALRYEPAARQRVIELTRCHPALIQLLGAEIVNLKNKQPITERRLAKVTDVEAAIPEALQHGRFFFADIANNQVTKEGLQMLQFIAKQGEGAVIERVVLEEQFSETVDKTLTNLLQRELVEPNGKGYCFQVELVRRWFV